MSRVSCWSDVSGCAWTRLETAASSARGRRVLVVFMSLDPKSVGFREIFVERQEADARHRTALCQLPARHFLRQCDRCETGNGRAIIRTGGELPFSHAFESVTTDAAHAHEHRAASGPEGLHRSRDARQDRRELRGVANDTGSREAGERPQTELHDGKLDACAESHAPHAGIASRKKLQVRNVAV